MGFSDLPLELIHQIADYLGFERDINALVRTSKRFYSALNRYLHRHHVEHWDADAFVYACKSGFCNSVRMFFDAGMPLDACDHGRSPLTLAATFGHEDIVKFLLEKGVDSSVKKPYDMWTTPFNLAIQNGHEGTARLLLPHLECVDYFVNKVNDGRTPLTLAAENGHLNLVKMLVEELKCNVEPTRAGASGTSTPYQKDGRKTWKMSPLAHAAHRGHTDVVRYLINVGADLNVTCGLSWGTALGHAVVGNHLETAKVLIEQGSNPNHFIEPQRVKFMAWGEANPLYKTFYFDELSDILFPITRANDQRNQEMVNLLFQHIDLERILERDIEYVSVLLPFAAACGIDGFVRRLLEKGCDAGARMAIVTISFPVLDADTPLSLASKFGHIGIVQNLLGHGADPNEPSKADDGFMKRPLVAAASAGHEQVVGLLLDAGANPYTIVKLAARSEPMLKMILDHGVDPSTLDYPTRMCLLQEVLSSQDVSILRTLLDSRFDFSIDEICGAFGYVMQQAACEGTAVFEYMMQYLWDKYGLKPGPQCDESYSALQFAVMSQNTRVVEIFILRYGLKLESENAVTYLALAASGYDPNGAEVMLDLLLRHGADINATRSDGETCLSLLVNHGIYGDLQGVKLVIKRGAKYPLTYVKHGICFLSIVTRRCLGTLELLLGLIDAQGISSEDIEPHLQEAQARNADDDDSSMFRLQRRRALQYFRCRRMYPVP